MPVDTNSQWLNKVKSMNSLLIGDGYGLVLFFVVPYSILSTLAFWGVYYGKYIRKEERIRVFHLSRIYLIYHILFITSFCIFESFWYNTGSKLKIILENTLFVLSWSCFFTFPVFLAEIIAKRTSKDDGYKIQYGVSFFLSLLFQIIIFIIYAQINATLHNTPD